VTVSGGSLAGTGTVTGAITLNNTAVSGIDLRDGTTGTLSGSSLTCSGGANSGNNRLTFDLGDSGNCDKIVLAGAHTAANAGSVIIRLNVLSGTAPSGTYTLIQGGAASTLTGYTLETSRFGGRVYTLGTSGNDLQVTVSAGNAGPSATSWTGGSSTDWTQAGNWTSGVPGYNTDVTFYNSGAANLSTVLNQDFEIKSLTFSGDAGTAVTIAKGTGNMLTIRDANGVTVTGSPSAGHTISVALGICTNQTWSVDTSKKLTVSGAVSDLGGGYGITKIGEGSLALSGNSTFTGGFTFNAGTLMIASAGTAGANGPLGNGGTFTFNGGTLGASATANITVANVNPIILNADLTYAAGSKSLTLPGAITLTGDRIITVNCVSGDALNLNGVISGNYSLTKNGPYYLNISGANTFTGGLTLKAGKLNGYYGTGTLTVEGGIINNGPANSVLVKGSFSVEGGGGGVNFGGSITLDGSYKIKNDKTGPMEFKGTMNLGTGNTLTCEMNCTSYAWTLSGAISGNNSSLVKTGNYPLTLSNANNTYSGSTIVSNGTLVVTSSGRLLNSPLISVSDGATLNSSNAVAFSSIAVVSLGTTATMALNYTGTNTVDQLFINGKQKMRGVYGSETSQFTGTGYLLVTSGPQRGTVIKFM
jgi:autotransporter-associated beta strand protein